MGKPAGSALFAEPMGATQFVVAELLAPIAGSAAAAPSPLGLVLTVVAAAAAVVAAFALWRAGSAPA